MKEVLFNIVARWSSHLIDTLEGYGWNLGLETDCLDRGFYDFPWALQADAGIVP
jgi:hypothetical protein